MFSKLVRVDFRSTRRIIPVLYAAIALVIGLMFLLSAILPPHLQSILMMPAVFLILGGVGVYFASYILIIMHYHRSLFGKGGAYTMTLPVNKGQLYASKFLVSCVWMLLSLLVMLAAILVFGACLLVAAAPGSISSLWEATKTLVSALWVQPELILWMGVMLLIETLAQVAVVFASITIANCGRFSRNNIAFSFVFYLVFYVIQSIVNVVVMLFFPLSIRLSFHAGGTHWALTTQPMASSLSDMIDGSNNIIGLGTLFSSILFAVVLIGFSVWLLRRKVNLR